jgi:hypothetical protein
LLLLVVNAAGFLLLKNTYSDLLPGNVAILSCAFAATAFISVLIFLKGQTKEPGSRIVYTLTAMGAKFLLEMILALFWFFIFKKISFPSVLLFFVLYLAFTLFTVYIILNTLKKNNL